MKSKRLFTAIGNIDDKFITEEAEGIAAVKDNKVMRSFRFAPWLKLAMPVAACLVIAVGIFVGQSGLFTPNGVGDGTDFTPPNSNSGSNLNDSAVNPSGPSVESTAPNDIVLQIAYGFVMGDNQYSPISFDERKKYGLVEQDALGSTPDNIYVITERDLGEKMGVVENSADESLIGATVYHYSAFPDSDAIIIVNVKTLAQTGEPMPQTSVYSESGYEFYTFAGKSSLGSLSSDEILEDYGIAVKTVSQIEVLASDHSPVVTIRDNVKISEILGIIRGKEDIGLVAHEELMQNWLKPYDDEGVDRAQLFLEVGQRWITITSKTGIELSFIYNPFVRSLCTHDSFYILTEDDAIAMNTLLMVNQ